jgi:tetratricopeptide (TPR) repeat protein
VGWGYGGWGWGYPGWGLGFGYWPYFDYGTAWGLFGGYGGYQGYGNYGFGDPHEGEEDGYTPAPSAAPATPTPEDDFEVQVTVPPQDDYAARAVQDFSAGRYREAIHQFRHAILDEPHNGRLMLLLSQALFAVGRYEEAAGAAEMGMRVLSEDKWGSVVKDYAKFYRSPALYESQIRDLEKARNGRPEAPALRVLLGYHFGYLGFPKHAVRELDKAIQLEPRDPYAAQLRNLFAKQIGLEPVPVVKPGPGNQPLKEPGPPAKEAPDVPAEH